ncbi:hypothetical protein [Gordonia araii]|uniref:hypothetical protein n=1 Tax=Gordonia araii TaxID=263909 RepID=UPI0002F48CAD|nr:hypothetical protein [Gordonia araii]NNG96374.1 hypothetical protein [Gordonia araii NBRC 100433]
MAKEMEGFSPIVIAALKSPEGTTVEELRAKFTKPEDRMSSIEVEFRARLDEARFEWSRVNGWTIPDDVSERLRGDVLWEMKRDGWER